jgi:hypothetical protein
MTSEYYNPLVTDNNNLDGNAGCVRRMCTDDTMVP